MFFLQIAHKLALPVENTVENPSPKLSGSDSKPCHHDLKSCKGDPDPCSHPKNEPSIFPGFQHIYSIETKIFPDIPANFVIKYFSPISP